MNSTTVWEHVSHHNPSHWPLLLMGWRIHVVCHQWEYMNGPGMNSHNHPALASVGAWLYRWVLGLRLGDGTLDLPDHSVYGKGFKKALFAPGCVTDARLPSATGRITTLYGPIEAKWAKSATAITMVISLPANTAGEVVIPTPAKAATSTVTEGGKVVWKGGKFVAGVPGVVSIAGVDGAIHITVGSGSYSLSATIS